VSWICWFRLDRTCVPRTKTVQDGGGEHGERQGPLRKARAGGSQKRHRCCCAVDASLAAWRVTLPPSDSRPQNRVRVNLSVKISKSAPPVTSASNQTMSSSNTETQVEAPAAKAVVPKQKKLKPARKQIKAGDVDKETAPQTGKEYSACPSPVLLH
jgi:hypothetical protein